MFVYFLNYRKKKGNVNYLKNKRKKECHITSSKHVMILCNWNSQIETLSPSIVKGLLKLFEIQRLADLLKSFCSWVAPYLFQVTHRPLLYKLWHILSVGLLNFTWAPPEVMFLFRKKKDHTVYGTLFFLDTHVKYKKYFD